MQTEELAPSIFYTTICLLYKTCKKLIKYDIERSLYEIKQKIKEVKETCVPNNYIISLIAKGIKIISDELHKLSASPNFMIDISDDAMRYRFINRPIHKDINEILKLGIEPMPASLRYTIRSSDYIGLLLKDTSALYCKCKTLIKEYKFIKYLNSVFIEEKTDIPSITSETSRFKQLLYNHLSNMPGISDELYETIYKGCMLHDEINNKIIFEIIQKNKKTKSECIVSAFKTYIRPKANEEVQKEEHGISMPPLMSNIIINMKSINITPNNKIKGTLKRTRDGE